MPEDRARGAPRLRVALSTIGTFHTFDLARQLEAAGMLASIHTGYPRFKLGGRGVSRQKIRSFPWLQGPYMAGWVPRPLRGEWEHWSAASFAAFVAATLPDCDVYCGLSGSGLHAGRLAKRRGARYVCDRGSTHIRFQDEVLREEHARWRVPYRAVDPRAIEREEAEYEEADVVLVPSHFVRSSFLDRGVGAAKLRVAPYGVDLARFAPAGSPATDRFDCLFVGNLSVRKGAGYLFAAYRALAHPRKSLTVAGTVDPRLAPMLAKFVGQAPAVSVLGHVPQEQLARLMSRAHVLVLPSIEEGLALVQAQALACGCPVVATRNTGAEDLYADGREGFIVAPRDGAALAQALQRLADEPALRESMSRAALARVQGLGGWSRYGALVIDCFTKLAADARPSLGLVA